MKLVRICLILGIIFAFGVSSCTGFFNTEEERFTGTEKLSQTFIWFNNSANSLSASVYSSVDRISKIATLEAGFIAGDEDDYFSWTPNEDGYSFYITYHLPLTNRFTVPYIPLGLGKDVVEISIPKGSITQVVIPKLYGTDGIVGGDDQLFNDVHVVITNSGPSGFRLTRQTAIINPVEPGNTSIVNPGDTALYRFPGTAAQYYKITIGGTEYPMPAALTSFESGYLYVLDFRGGAVTLTEKKLLTLNNLAN